MIQVYSSNQTVAANTAYPLNNVTLKKGCTVALSGPSTIQLNQRGVYLVQYDGFAAPTAETGAVSTQLYVNGVAQPEAISSFEATGIGDAQTLHFESLVQVSNNNCPCNCTSSPTILQFMNGDVAIEEAHINVLITKIC